jgi:D-alanyl-D-alanine carboxypeptidase
MLLAAVVVACGNATPTSTPAPYGTNVTAPSATPSPLAPSATATPNISIVPVPTSQLAAPVAYAAHLDAATAKALRTALSGIRSSGKFPGVSAAVMFPDGEIWTGVSGTAVASSSTLVTTDTLFSVGSITKTFISALIGRLAQEGTIGLDDPLSKYVPDFTNAAKISIRQLLSHTAGIRDLFDKSSTLPAAVAANRAKAWTTAQVLATIKSPYWAPGKGYLYSNTDYVLLGMAIEKATGKKVAELVRSDFLTPLGMTHTYLQTEETAPGPKAHGYMAAKASCNGPCDNSAGGMIPYTAEATVAGFAGAYVSTASDLAIWANALYRGYVLDEATLASMVDLTPSMSFKAKPTFPYGLGFEETTVGGQVAWGHRGHLDGFWSAMEYLPASHLTVVVLANADWATNRIMPGAGTLSRVATAGG